MKTSQLLILISFYFLLLTIPKTQSATTDFEADRVCESGDYENYERKSGYRTIDHYAEDSNCEKVSYAHKFYCSQFVKGKQSSYIKFLISIALELLLALAFVIVFALYIFFICCWRCHCCLFKEFSEKEQYKLTRRCKYLKLVFIIIFFIISAGVSAIAFIHISAYKKSVNLSDCGFLHFTNHGLYGLSKKENKTLYHYGGSFYLKDSLINSSYSLGDISNSYSSIFQKYSSIINLDTDFNNDIVNYNDYAINNHVFSANPTTSLYDYIRMNYQDIFGGYTNSDTILGILYKNYKEQITPIVESLKQMKSDFELMISNQNSYVTELQTTSEYFKSMENMYNLINDNIGQFYSNFKKKSITLANAAKVFYAINVILIILLFIFYFWYICKKESTYCVTKVVRIIIHIIWNLLFLFTIIGFLTSFLFAVYRRYCYNLIPSFNSLISFDTINDRVSDENLFIDYAESKDIELFNVCYNPTHTTNLIDILGIRDNILSYFNSIYQHYNILLQVLNKSLEITSIETYINQKLTEIDTYIYNISKTTSYETHAEADVSIYIKILNRYTDFSDSDGYQIDCITKTYDRWATNKEDCPNGFTYSIDGTQSKNCLIINEWDTDSVYFRYMGTCMTKSSESTAGYVNIYFSRIKKYIEKNKQLVSDMKQSVNVLIDIYNDIIDEIEDEIDDDKKVFENFTHPFSMILGNEVGLSIYDMFDCGLLKDDLIDFYDVTRNKLSKISIFHLVAILIYSLFNFIAICIFLKQLYIFKRQPIEEIEELPPEKKVSSVKEKEKENEKKENVENVETKANEKEVEIISINKSNKFKTTINKTNQDNGIKGTKSKLFVSLGKNKPASLSSEENSINKKSSEISDILSEENLDQKERDTRYSFKKKKGNEEEDEESDQESGPKDKGSAMS